MRDSIILLIFGTSIVKTLTRMTTTTLTILVIIVVCVALVAFNRYHNKSHHYNTERLAGTVKDILSVQPEKMMKREDFLNALQRKTNCPTKEAHWLMGYAKEHGLIVADDKWVELPR